MKLTFDVKLPEKFDIVACRKESWLDGKVITVFSVRAYTKLSDSKNYHVKDTKYSNEIYYDDNTSEYTISNREAALDFLTYKLIHMQSFMDCSDIYATGDSFALLESWKE